MKEKVKEENSLQLTLVGALKKSQGLFLCSEYLARFRMLLEALIGTCDLSPNWWSGTVRDLEALVMKL